ncbi:MAG: YceI family protein [Planctomycetota bacterium]
MSTARSIPQSFAIVAALLASALVAVAAFAADDPVTEQLVVFVQPNDGEVAEAFEAETLPQVREVAEAMGVEVVVVDVTQDGAPESVRLTPLMVYQNHRGRFPYLGRFTTLDRLRNHVRTARFGGAPEDVRTVMKAVPSEAMQRATLGTPIKVTPWVGPGVDAVKASTAGQGMPSVADLSQVDGSAAAAMHLSPISLYRAGIHAALGTPSGGAPPMDRLFYADFYPYLDADGTVYVSTALFSQFHCHEPVFVSSEPVSGPWTQTQQVFEQAADVLAAEVQRQLASPAHGDGFDAIAADAPRPTWDELGLPLPPKPEGPDIDPADLEIVRNWTVDQAAVAQRPVVQFRFPEPIVGYVGEAQELTGSVTLGEGLTLADATGEFVVPARSVTMGEPDLDSHIHSGILNARDFPTSSFTLSHIEVPDGATPAFGQVVPGKLVGRFQLKTFEIDLTVPVSIEAFVGEDGKPRLAFAGTWTLGPLDETFQIADAPPGPDEAAKSLRFDSYIVLEPAE